MEQTYLHQDDVVALQKRFHNVKNLMTPLLMLSEFEHPSDWNNDVIKLYQKNIQLLVEEIDGLGDLLCEHGESDLVESRDSKMEFQSESPSSQDIGSNSATILLVEDDENIRSIIKKVLQQKGFHVLDAENGVKALGQFESQSNKIDLVITDIQMPEMNGLELIECLNKKGYDSPVLVITAQDHFEQSLESNVHLLTKPHRTSDLLDKIGILLK